jgi:hypothetical protein
MDKVYQVFVSSTYSDLKEERRRVSETLAKAGYIPAGMELFPATDKQQLEFIKRVIDRCDYYVVILGGRYGTLADSNISFTEKEYDYAVSMGIPVLAFLHSNPDKIEAGKTERDQKQERRLAAFRAKLSKGRIVDFWNDQHDLCTKVVIAVAQAINLAPGIGWVRGDQAVDPKVMQEMERFRADNESLKQKVADLQRSEIVFPPNLLGPNDEITMELMMRVGNETTSTNIALTPEYVIRTTVNLLTKESSENAISRHLAVTYVYNFMRKKYDEDASMDFSSKSVMQMRFQLEALDLIKAESRRGTKLTYITWALTEMGRRYVSNLFALKK